MKKIYRFKIYSAHDSTAKPEELSAAVDMDARVDIRYIVADLEKNMKDEFAAEPDDMIIVLSDIDSMH